MEVLSIIVSSGGTGVALSVHEQGCGGWAILALFVVLVPDLSILTGNALRSVIVGKVGWAHTLSGVGIKDEVGWA